jgi:hypothetical protein
MLEGDDPGLGTGIAVLQSDHLGLGAKRVANENGLGHAYLVVAEIGDEGAERGVADRKAYHQRECEGAVDDDTAEFGPRRIFGVQVERLRVMGQRRNQKIVGLGHGAVRLVPDPIADRPFVEITAGHLIPPPFRSLPATPLRSLALPGPH